MYTEISNMPSKFEFTCETQDLDNSIPSLISRHEDCGPNMASLLHPLNKLLQKRHKWEWSSFRQPRYWCIITQHFLFTLQGMLLLTEWGQSFLMFIQMVLNAQLLMLLEHFRLEKKYAQVEKEALSLIFGITMFHKYLYGRHFTIFTDHKPLTTIFGPNKAVPPLAAAQLQRWALILSAYDYDISFKPMQEHANIDGLSRLPLPSAQSSNSSEYIFNVCQIEGLPVTYINLKTATRQDPILSQVLNYTKNGWPDQVPDYLKPFCIIPTELTLEGECVL